MARETRGKKPAELAKEIECGKRNIYRYVKLLRDCGINIKNVGGRRNSRYKLINPSPAVKLFRNAMI